jgi:NADP-dependent 3-hydroxy acid dehydrogenase YdfG
VSQADGSVRAEPRMRVEDVARAVVYMASLPLDSNVMTMTVIATKMPFIGRG